VIVGAGLAGLAALRLRQAGWQVVLCDNARDLGGKMSRWCARGYRFDTGPTLLTMPQILRRLYQDIGERLEDHLQLEALDPHAVYLYPDGRRIEVPAKFEAWLETVRRIAPEDVEGVRQLHAVGERIYRLSEITFFLRDPLIPLRAPPAAALRLLPIRHAWGNYANTVARFLKSPHLRQIYNRYPTYVGSSPFQTPATLLVIPYIEHTFGAWYPIGGMYRITESLGELAARRGVEILTQTRITAILHRGGRVEGVRADSGGRIEADAVVFNGDAASLSELLGEKEPFDPVGRSLSGVVLLYGLRRSPAALYHHTVLFSSDYEQEFRELFEHRFFPSEPTVYVNAPPDAGPPGGGQAVYLMANAPGAGEASWFETHADEARRRVLKRVEGAGLGNFEQDTEVFDTWSPVRFEQRYLSPGGSIYGWNSHGWRRAFLRPPNRHPGYRGLYCAGGSFHPGGGVPMVLLSAEIAVRQMLEDSKP